MNLILCPSDKRIIHISKTISYNKVGGLILDSGLHIAPGICEVAEVKSVPAEIIPEKYCYVKGSFVINKDYIEPETE